MPIFDLKCPKCSHRELDQLLDSTETIPCGKCGEQMERMMGVPAQFQWKESTVQKFKTKSGIPFEVHRDPTRDPNKPHY
jgi:putative FmdB family regulatory protein